MRVYFLDFDGTMTVEDIGDNLIKIFAKDGWQHYLDLWIQRKMTTQECANREWGLIDGPSDEMYRFIDTRVIDPYLTEFLDYCKKNKFETYINSDGYDFYIKRILKNYNLDIKGYYNHIHWDNKWVFNFPYSDDNCQLCGNCKTNHVKKFKNDGYEVIYIGDGYSDRCASSFADVIYAKNHLLEYCVENNIPHIPIKSFKEVISNELKRDKKM